MNKKSKMLSTFLFILMIILPIIPTRSLTVGGSEEELSLTVFTDKQSYLNGELVKVSGTVQYLNATPAEGAAIGIEVKDCRNNTIFLDITSSSPSGTYEDNFRVHLTAVSGTYMVFATAYKMGYLPASAKTTFYVYAEAKPDFILSVSPSSQRVTPGETANYTITVTSINGFTSPVILTGNAINNLSLTFTPEIVTPPSNGYAQSKLTVSVSSTIVPGTYNINIKGTSEEKEHFTIGTLNVYIPGKPDFNISASPPTQKIDPGGSASYTIKIESLNDFSSEVRLSGSTSPPSDDITLTFEPETVIPPKGGRIESTLTVFTTPSTTSDTYEIAITGVGDGKTRTTTVELVILPSVDWETLLTKFNELKGIYKIYKRYFFNNSWWGELARGRAEAAANYDVFKSTAEKYVETWLEFLGKASDFPISPLLHMWTLKGLVESLIRVYNMFLSMYLSNVAMSIWASYSTYDIRNDLDSLLDKADSVILALNEHDYDALTLAFQQLQQATEDAYAGSKKFDDAFYDVIWSNPAFDLLPFLTKTKIYYGIRPHLIAFRETLILSYIDVTYFQGEPKYLYKEKPNARLTPRYGLPRIKEGYWEVNRERVTEAQKGQEVKAHIIVSTTNFSSIEHDKVEGTITMRIKKDLRFWFDQEYAKKTWDIQLTPGETIDLELPFTPDETSGITLKGYFIEVTFSGKYVYPDNIVSDKPVKWDDGSEGAMKDAYPPRLFVREGTETAMTSGTMTILKETQHRLYLHVYDAQGRHIGLNYKTNKVEIQIPNSEYYDDFNGTMAIVIPPNITDFRVQVDAKYARQENESYELTVLAIKNLEIKNQTSTTAIIQKGMTQSYTIQISPEKRVSINPQKETPLYYYIVSVTIAAAIAGTMAAFAVYRKRKTPKSAAKLTSETRCSTLNS